MRILFSLFLSPRSNRNRDEPEQHGFGELANHDWFD
jgi:hypothetical protein